MTGLLCLHGMLMFEQIQLRHQTNDKCILYSYGVLGVISFVYYMYMK